MNWYKYCQILERETFGKLVPPNYPLGKRTSVITINGDLYYGSNGNTWHDSIVSHFGLDPHDIIDGGILINFPDREKYYYMGSSGGGYSIWERPKEEFDELVKVVNDAIGRIPIHT